MRYLTIVVAVEALESDWLCRDIVEAALCLVDHRALPSKHSISAFV